MFSAAKIRGRWRAVRISQRIVGGVAVIDVQGRITAGEGVETLRDKVNSLLHQDHRNPLKAQRPIASGALGVNAALAAASVLALGALIVAYSLGLPFLATAA